MMSAPHDGFLYFYTDSSRQKAWHSVFAQICTDFTIKWFKPGHTFEDKEETTLNFGSMRILVGRSAWERFPDQAKSGPSEQKSSPAKPSLCFAFDDADAARVYPFWCADVQNFKRWVHALFAIETHGGPQRSRSKKTSENAENNSIQLLPVETPLDVLDEAKAGSENDDGDGDILITSDLMPDYDGPI